MIECSACKQVKPFECFWKDNKMKNGLRSQCKICLAKINTKNIKKWYLKNKVEHNKKTLTNLETKRFGKGNVDIVLKRDGYKCVKCGMTNEQHKKKWKYRITIDHIDGNGAYSKVKNNEMSNLQTLCLSCHGKKDNPKKAIAKAEGR